METRTTKKVYNRKWGENLLLYVKTKCLFPKKKRGGVYGTKR